MAWGFCAAKSLRPDLQCLAMSHFSLWVLGGSYHYLHESSFYGYHAFAALRLVSGEPRYYEG